MVMETSQRTYNGLSNTHKNLLSQKEIACMPRGWSKNKFSTTNLIQIPLNHQIPQNDCTPATLNSPAIGIISELRFPTQVSTDYGSIYNIRKLSHYWSVSLTVLLIVLLIALKIFSHLSISKLLVCENRLLL